MTAREKRRQVREELWRLGNLGWLLHPGQKRVRTAVYACPARRFVFNCSRRWGKSYLLCALAVECALSGHNKQVKYAAPTARDVRKIILPLMREIFDTCPEDVKPTWNQVDGTWTFKNGSQIHVAGVDNGNADSLRGQASDLAIVDEAGFVSDLEYVDKNVLMPQLITTNGRIIISSTPAVSPGHPFQAYCVDAEARGAYVKQTIHDAPHIDARRIEEWCYESGGPESSTWRREYLAEHVTDEGSAVIPEWERSKHLVVCEHPRPEYAHAFVAMDQGYYDLTVAVFGYYDFKAGLDVIEDELVFERATSDIIAAAVTAKERELWGDLEPLPRPMNRFVDAPAIVIADLCRLSGQTWALARKDDAEAALNSLRISIAGGKMRIHPRCKVTISHLAGAVWNKSRTSFERSPGLGHFDAVDAVKYFHRGINRHANPWPLLPKGVSHDNHWVPPRLDAQTKQKRLAKAFGRG